MLNVRQDFFYKIRHLYSVLQLFSIYFVDKTSCH